MKKIKQIFLFFCFLWIFLGVSTSLWAIFVPGEKGKKDSNSVQHLKAFRPLSQVTHLVPGPARKKIDLLEIYLHKPPLKSTQKEALSAFAATVPGFRVRFSTRTGLPVFMKGEPLYQPLSAGLMAGKKAPALSTAFEALERYRGLMRLRNPREEFSLRKEIVDRAGRRHLRLSQRYQGLRYFGKELTVHLKPDGSVYLIAGRYAETPKDLNTTPNITSVQACELAHIKLASEEEGCRETELVIYEDQAGIPHLTWRVDLCRNPADCWRYFVDAHTGEVIKKYSITYQVAVSGSGQDVNGHSHQFSVWQEGGQYYFVDTSHPNHQQDPNVAAGELGRGNIVILSLPYGVPDYQAWLTSSNPHNWPQEAVTIWYHLKLTYDYYRQTHGRCGMDGQCQNAVGAFPLQEANAFYASTYNDFMFFGQGDGYQMGPLYALDVVAHEFTHGVTHYTAGLEYQFQSGALNEAFSDIFAAMVDREDWLIGEDVVLVPPYNLRNLINPHQSLNPQPATMEEYRDLPIDQDNGGVHINATIPAHLIYILAQELGLGREKVEHICYKVLSEILTPQSNFEDFCLALEQAAGELYGPNEAQAAREACNRVGIQATGGGAGGGGGEEPPIPPISGEDFVLFIFYQLEGGEIVPYVGELTPQGEAFYLSETPAFDTRPAPYMYNGVAWALFVDRDHNLRAANMESESYEEMVVNSSGEIWSVATTPAAEVIAYTSTSETDSNIYLYHPQTNQVQTVPVRFQPPDAATALETFFPDVVTFGPDGQTVFFDCFNQVRLGQKSYRFWNIGVLDLITGKTLMLFSVPPEGYHIGNPAAAHIHPNLLAFDVWSETEVETMVANLRSGQVGLVWQGAREAGLGTSGWPSFSGDDAYVYLQDLDPFYAEVLIRVPLQESGGVWSGNMNAAEPVWVDEENGLGITRAVAFRKGTISVNPRAEVSPQSLDFGSVSVGGEKRLTVTLRNTGNYPLDFLGSQVEGSSAFSTRAVHTSIDPGQSYEIEVVFRPESAGSFSAILHILTSDPERKDIPVSLRGVAAGSVGRMRVDVLVNGSQAPGVVRDRVRISVSLDPQGQTGTGDYFLWARIPGGDCYCYAYPGLWNPCSCTDPAPAYQGGLVFLNDFFVPPAVSAGQLPVGDYTLYFAVDAQMNSLLDEDAARDEVQFSISP